MKEGVRLLRRGLRKIRKDYTERTASTRQQLAKAYRAERKTIGPAEMRRKIKAYAVRKEPPRRRSRHR